MYSTINYPIRTIKITNIAETTVNVFLFESNMTQGMHVAFTEDTVLSIIEALISK